MLHVRGGQDPVQAIARMCQQHGWIAYDMLGDTFISLKEPNNQSFTQWQAYRGAIVSGEAPQEL
jgi:hypothetical protein